MAESLDIKVISEHVVPKGEGVTFRALVFGLGIVLWIVFWNSHAEYLAHTSRMNISHFPMVLLCTFVLVVLGNQAVRW
ncbi:MAG: putative membrane protein, partial [Candidatus Latescibacterota bacterium]